MADRDERWIREGYAEMTRQPRTDHPGEDTWERLAADELTGQDRDALFDHVGRCAECAQVYKGLQLLAREASTFDPAATPIAPDTRVRATPTEAPRWWFAGLAAAAVLVLGLLLRPPSSPTLSPSPGDQVRSDALPAPVPVEPLGTQARVPERFRWEPVAGAGHYRVELMAANGDVLWSSPMTSATAIEWPAGVAKTPGRYYWRVTASPAVDHPMGAPAASGLVSFEIPQS